MRKTLSLTLVSMLLSIGCAIAPRTTDESPVPAPDAVDAGAVDASEDSPDASTFCEAERRRCAEICPACTFSVRLCRCD